MASVIQRIATNSHAVGVEIEQDLRCHIPCVGCSKTRRQERGYLGPERGPGGEPSAADFLRFELLPLIDVIAERFDEFPEALPGHPEYRVLITSGRLVAYISIMGMVRADGSVELIQLELDLGESWPE